MRPYPRRTKQKSDKENNFGIGVTFLDLVTLYVNLMLAKQDPNIGYQDINKSVIKLNREMTETSKWMKHQELEPLLWACQQMDEQGKFWCAKEGVPFRTFVNKLLNYKQTELYFNEVYSWIHKKPKKGKVRHDILNNIKKRKPKRIKRWINRR
jgi:hypothetical protein